MTLCASCKGVDFRALLIASVKYCKSRQATDSEYSHGCETLTYRHHDDIFEVQKAGEKCHLCNTIFQAFKRRDVSNVDMARGLPIVFRSQEGYIEVCYETEEPLTNLCNLYWYMSASDVDAAFKDCSIKEDNYPPIYKLVEEDPSSKTSLRIASGWLRNCLENHENCKPARSTRPKRLIKVGCENQDPVLVDTEPAAQQMRWAALSYCWGDNPSQKLTIETMEVLKSGVPFGDLDPTIQDAILVTRALGLSYLWIDAWCIVQDKASGEWEEESSRMNDVYGGSAVTLVAANSRSVTEGFLKKRKGRYVSVLWSAKSATAHTSVAKSSARVFLSLDSHITESEVTWPWAKRGWTMQENYLPNRILYYTSSQLIWMCCEEKKWECGATKSLQDDIDTALEHGDDLEVDPGWLWSQDTFMQLKRLPEYLRSNLGCPWFERRKPFRLWYRLIEEYSPRNFSVESDRLLGISGLARLFGSITQNREYVAGLWREDLIRGLTWYTEGAKLLPRKPYNCAFPSWSWASVGGSTVKTNLRGEWTPLSSINDVRVTLVDPENPFGSILSGTITITGPLKRFPRLYNRNWESAESSIPPLERDLSSLIEKERPESVEAKYNTPQGGHFAALQMLRTHELMDLLILESLGHDINGFHVYCRVGVHTMPHGLTVSASPSLFIMLEEFEHSLAAQLGPPRKETVAYTASAKLSKELKSEPWKTGTVIIV